MRMQLVVFAALGVNVACTTPTSLCGCPHGAALAVVYGRISASGDTPLSGALIKASATSGTCPGRGLAFEGGFGETRSDATGTYRLLVSGGADTICAKITADRSASARIDSLVSLPATLVIGSGLSRDSARVDLRFP